MRTVDGTYLDGRTSRTWSARFTLDDGDVVRLSMEGGDEVTARVSDLVVSDRVGRIPRRVRFPEGGVFETTDNDGIDRILVARGAGGMLHHVGRWERSWRVALVSLAIVVVGSWAFVTFGVPVLAGRLAAVTPVAIDDLLGREGLAALDRLVFSASTLPEGRQAHLRARFATMVPGDAPWTFRLEFRAAKALGPNAFALPSGIVVVTDELVELARSDDEIAAVLAHEIGHVQGRHALRQLYHDAGVSVLAVAVLGDVSAASALVSAVPLLISAKNSRDLEAEADRHAIAWLDAQGLGRGPWDQMLCRMHEAAGDDGDDDVWAGAYLASHPPLATRAVCDASLTR